MKYTSTRNGKEFVDGSYALLQGIAEDGGLFVPEYIPDIKENLDDYRALNYIELAAEILSLFFDEFDKESIKDSVKKAYSGKFSTHEFVNIKNIDKYSFLELYHGTTAAFKDMALCLLPYLMNMAAKKQNDNSKKVILTATSGDTGKAALEGFKNVENYKVIVFYPENGVSMMQKKQMVTTDGNNTYVVGINGNFDDAQTGVKNIFTDLELKNFIQGKGYKFSSANSINIGRLIPQIIYYFYGYFSMEKSGAIKKNQKIDVSVPTGNFGNILAAYYAKRMGLPIDKLICASNKNNVLTDFFNTGHYNIKREFYITESPSMDILISSNLERYLYYILDKNTDILKEKMSDLKTKKEFEISNIGDKNNIKAYYFDDEDGRKAINKCFKEYQYLMDTHTAIAYLAAEKSDKKTLVASTASPYKFIKSVYKSLTDEDIIDEIKYMDKLSDITNTKIPENIKELKNKNTAIGMKCDVNNMKNTVINLLGD